MRAKNITKFIYRNGLLGITKPYQEEIVIASTVLHKVNVLD